MKRNIIISLIVALMLVILPNSVKALETESGSFPDVPNDGNDSYFITQKKDGVYNLYTFNQNQDLTIYSDVNTDHLSISTSLNQSATSTVDYKRYILNNDSWVYWNNKGNYSFGIAAMIATTYSIHGYESGIGWVPNVYEPGYGLKKPGINLTKNSACDLNGIDFYHIEADFSEIVDTELTFQVKIGDNDWLDITEYINDHETYGYKYTYDAYYNLEFKVRVLYQDGTVKTENSISVTELSSFSLQNYKKYSFTGNYKYALIRSETMTNSNVDFIIDSNYVDRKNSKTELLEVDYFNKEARFCYVYNDINLVGNYYRLPLKVDEYNYIFPVIVRQNINELITFYVPQGYYVIFSNENGSEISVDGTDKEIDFDNIDIAYLNSLISDFMNKNNNAVSLVRNIFSIFFDDMPEEIYQSVVLVLFVIFIGVILAVVGWK